MGIQINEEEIRAKLQQAFKAADEDGDGLIDAGDLMSALKHAGLSPSKEQVNVSIISFFILATSGPIGQWVLFPFGRILKGYFIFHLIA